MAKHDFNEIASWGENYHWHLDTFKDELQSRSLAVRPFDVFALLSRATRQTLAANDIDRVTTLLRFSAEELATLPRIGTSRVGEIENTLQLANLILRPIIPSDDRLLVLEQHIQQGRTVEETAVTLGVSVWKANELRKKAASARGRHRGAERVFQQWQKQFTDHVE